MLDALQQRLNRYREAGIQARASGNERKARMHERIAKVSPWLCSPYPMLACPGSVLPCALSLQVWSSLSPCLFIEVLLPRDPFSSRAAAFPYLLSLHLQ